MKRSIYVLYDGLLYLPDVATFRNNVNSFILKFRPGHIMFFFIFLSFSSINFFKVSTFFLLKTGFLKKTRVILLYRHFIPVSDDRTSASA